MEDYTVKDILEAIGTLLTLAIWVAALSIWSFVF